MCVNLQLKRKKGGGGGESPENLFFPVLLVFVNFILEDLCLSILMGFVDYEKNREKYIL